CTSVRRRLFASFTSSRADAILSPSAGVEPRRSPSRCDAPPGGEVRPEPFSVGVNLPWRRYGCDFGTNAWRIGGLTGHDAAPIRRALEEAADAGATVVRWFVLCDGRAGIDFTPDGWPVRLQPGVL